MEPSIGRIVVSVMPGLRRGRWAVSGGGGAPWMDVGDAGAASGPLGGLGAAEARRGWIERIGAGHRALFPLEGVR